MTRKLKYLVGGEWKLSSTEEWYEITNSSTGEVMAEAPRCTPEEVDEAIAVAKAAFQGDPVSRGVQIHKGFRRGGEVGKCEAVPAEPGIDLATANAHGFVANGYIGPVHAGTSSTAGAGRAAMG